MTVPRETCPRCRRPLPLCLCPSEAPMPTRTRFVLLMHPMEWRRVKCNTGRLTCLNLENSEIVVGTAFDRHPRVRELLEDPGNWPALLYPGPGSRDLGEGGLRPEELGGRRLVAFLIDATWPLSRKIIRESPGLLELPRLMFRPAAPSRYRIKKQPKDYCLSTLETVHELLLALEGAGLDAYPDKTRLLEVFERMQAVQVESAAAKPRPRYLGKGMEREIEEPD